VGRGPGATQLAELRVGSTATVRWGLVERPAFAIGGERVLLRDRAIQVRNDRELHPRTAVGIDRDKDRILLLVVDGRSSRSRGFTLVELARTLKKLGAVHALNLDGGGSTTMAADNTRGQLRVVNAPSDGSQRSIPDGIAITYSKPRG
jgi:exopolysaccharide biosynthesis protein